jgi:hypothetical protein
MEAVSQVSQVPRLDGLVRTYHEVEQCQYRDETEVDLADHLLLGTLGVVLIEVGLLCSETNVCILVVVDFDVVNLLKVFFHRCSVGGLCRHGEYRPVAWCSWRREMTVRRIANDKTMGKIGSVGHDVLRYISNRGQ